MRDKRESPPDGWLIQGNLWMHIGTGTSVTVVDDRVKSLLAYPSTVTDLQATGEALAELGQWLAKKTPPKG